jgi:hypothetical protein
MSSDICILHGDRHATLQLTHASKGVKISVPDAARELLNQVAVQVSKGSYERLEDAEKFVVAICHGEQDKAGVLAITVTEERRLSISYQESGCATFVGSYGQDWHLAFLAGSPLQAEFRAETMHAGKLAIRGHQSLLSC